MEDFSIFVIIVLVSLIILTIVKIYKEIQFIKKDKEKSKEMFDYLYDKDKKM